MSTPESFAAIVRHQMGEVDRLARVLVLFPEIFGTNGEGDLNGQFSQYDPELDETLRVMEEAEGDGARIVVSLKFPFGLTDDSQSNSRTIVTDGTNVTEIKHFNHSGRCQSIPSTIFEADYGFMDGIGLILQHRTLAYLALLSNLLRGCIEVQQEKSFNGGS